jgi:hypothetical protein
MLFSVSVMVLAAMLLPVALILGARRWGMQEAEVDARLHSPRAHTVAYVVPEGQDPALVRVALSHAGFVTVLDRGGDQRLLVECEESRRDQVRSVIEHVDHGGFEGPELHVGHVRFEDEPA